MSATRLAEWQPQIAVVLGSGLSSLVEKWTVTARIPYTAFADLAAPNVAGHPAEFVLAEIAGKRLIFACGRVHLYEGYTASEVAAGVRLLANSGVRTVILTNAAGSLHPSYKPGSWMMIRDHLNLTGNSPLTGSAAFIDLTTAYSPRLQELFRNAATRANIRLHEGVYACVSGPQYETAAEVRMLKTLGADAVGMSTVPETIQARALDLEVAGFSCLTNSAAGMSEHAPAHGDVLRVSAAAAEEFRKLLDEALPDL